MTELSRSFGNAVRQVREERGWSQERLAEHADLNRSYVGDLERGRAMPSLATLTKLAAALGLQPSALVARFESASIGQART